MRARELVDAEHQLHRVVRRLIEGLHDLAVDGERDAACRPVRGVDVERARVDRDLDGREIVDDRRIAEGVHAIPTRVSSGRTSRPKISQTQVSAERSGSPSYPISQSATIVSGSADARDG